MKKWLFGTTEEKSIGAELSVTTLRVFAGLAMAFGHGINKVPPPEKFVSGVSAMGFPAPELFAWCASLSEFGGGLLLALGLMTRLGALGMAFTMAVAGFVAHAADPFNVKEMAFLFLVISLVFVFRGAGKYSLDHFISRKVSN